MPNIFGFPTPQELEQQRFAEAVQLYSNAAPGVALGVSAGQSASRLVGGLLGVKDVETERAERAQALAEDLMRDGVSPGTPEGIQEAVRRAKQRGLFDVAAALEQNSNKIQKEFLQSQKLEQDVIGARLDNAEKARMAQANASATGWGRLKLSYNTRPGATSESKKAADTAAGYLASKGYDPEQFSPEQFSEISDRVQFIKDTYGGSTSEKIDLTTREVTRSRTPDVPARMLDDMLAGFGQPQGVGRSAQQQPAAPAQMQPIEQEYNITAALAGYNPKRVDRLPKANKKNQPPVSLSSKSNRGMIDVTQVEGLGDAASLRVVGNLEGIDRFTFTNPNRDIVAAAKEANRSVDGYTKDILGPAVEDAKVNAITLRSLDKLADIMERNGAATLPGLRRYAQALGAVPSQNIATGAIQFFADIASSMSTMTMSENERAVVNEMNGVINQMYLDIINVRGLGAPTGPDLGLVRAIAQSPFGEDVARFGPRVFFRSMAGFYNQTLSDLKSNVKAGLTSATVSAPHEFWALGQGMADIIKAIEGQPRAAHSDIIKGIIGFRPSAKGLEMARSEGDYAPTSWIQKGINLVEDDLVLNPGKIPAYFGNQYRRAREGIQGYIDYFMGGPDRGLGKTPDFRK